MADYFPTEKIADPTISNNKNAERGSAVCPPDSAEHRIDLQQRAAIKHAITKEDELEDVENAGRDSPPVRGMLNQQLKTMTTYDVDNGYTGASEEEEEIQALADRSYEKPPIEE